MIRFFIKCFASIFICLTIWGSGLAWFVNQIPISPSYTTEQLDGVVVLTGGSKRIEHGLELLASQRAKSLFVSGVGKHSTLNDLLVLMPDNIRNTILPERIALGHRAENTIGNAEEVRLWLKKVKYKTLYLVTSNYHTPRSLLELHEATPDIVYVPSPVFPDDFNIQTWWSTKKGRTLVLLEYHKYLASKLRHWFISIIRDIK